MKTRSRDQGRTAGVGSVKRHSPGFGAMGETRRKTTFGSPDDNGSIEPQQRFFLALQKRPFALVPARAPSRKSVGVGMAPRSSSKLSRNAKKPIQSGASVGRRPRSRAVFTPGDGPESLFFAALYAEIVSLGDACNSDRPQHNASN